jgi:transposase
MAGRFEGLSDQEWVIFEDLFPTPIKRTRGYPKSPPRYVINSLLYVLITGCRWCDIPQGSVWASKSAAHRWLQRWQKDGTFDLLKAKILGLAQDQDKIKWEWGAIDGSFSPWQGRR